MRQTQRESDRKKLQKHNKNLHTKITHAKNESHTHVRKCPFVTQYFSHKNSYSLKATIKTQHERVLYSFKPYKRTLINFGNRM